MSRWGEGMLTGHVFAAVGVDQVILVFARLADTQVDEFPAVPRVVGPWLSSALWSGI